MIQLLQEINTFHNPFVTQVKETPKPKLEVLSQKVWFDINDDILTTRLVEKARIVVPEPKKKIEQIRFFDYQVLVGNRLRKINIRETGTIYNFFGLDIKTDVKKVEFIVYDGTVYYIKKDKFGTKYLSETE